MWSAWCSKTKRLVSETKTWVLETVVQKLKRGFGKLGSETDKKQLLKPTKPVAETDTNQFLKPTKPVSETDKANCRNRQNQLVKPTKPVAETDKNSC